MNLYQLQQFMFVAEEGSVTKGAERAAVSQPALSRAIADLESALGQRLFDRGPKGVKTTEAGRVLLEYARRIFALEQEADDALADLRGLQTGRITIGASTTIGDYLLPTAIGILLSQHPGVELSMDVANTDEIQHGVFEGRYDIGFTEGAVDRTRFEVSVLADDDLLIVASPHHPLAGLKAGLDELSRCGFVMREVGSGTRGIVENGFREAGFEPKVVCALGSTTAVKRAVAEGLGLGIVSVLAVDSELESGELVLVQAPLTFSRQLHTIRLSWRRESAALRRFMRILTEQLSSKTSVK